VGFQLPNGAPMTRGVIMLIERQGETFAAAYKSQTAIYPCFGAQDAASEESLKAALRRGGHEKVRRLVRTDDVPADTRWAGGPGWALTFE
jgi:hypothetical protein